MKKLSVIIVNYNVCHFLEQALLSVRKAAQFVDTEIIVVDNNSADKSVEMVKEKFPEVILVDHKINAGFSKANNIGIRMSKGEYVLLLNPDTVVEEQTFKKCCDFMDAHPHAGGLGVKMLDGKGVFLPESKRGLPTPWVAFSKVFGLAALFPKTKLFGGYHLGYLDNNQVHEVEILSGAYMLMRKTALDKVGLLDEEYFMYGEDIDLSYRIITGGYKNYYFPETRIIHYKGESTKRTSINYVFVFYRAMIIFARNHFNSSNAGLFSFLINFAIYIRASIDVISRFVSRAWQPVLDVLFLYYGIGEIKSYWEINHKHTLGFIPNDFMTVVVPVYIFIWITSIYFSGGYDKPFKVLKTIRGVIVGTIIISSITNFVDVYRYSKALILLGGFYTASLFIISRWVFHFIKYGNVKLGENIDKKVVLVGDFEESNRVINLIKQSNQKLNIIGFVAINDVNKTNPLFLGVIDRLSEIVQIYNANELIFCSKDIAAHQIIELMTQFDSNKIDFKIVPDNTNFVIGSNSKDSQGDLYTIDIQLHLFERNSLRSKRLLDVIMSLLFLLMIPLMLFIVNKPLSFIKNIFSVLFNIKTWVGLTTKEQFGNNKKYINAGVVSPTSGLKIDLNDVNTVKRLELLYAKNYETGIDLDIIFRNIKLL